MCSPICVRMWICVCNYTGTNRHTHKMFFFGFVGYVGNSFFFPPAVPHCLNIIMPGPIQFNSPPFGGFLK